MNPVLLAPPPKKLELNIRGHTRALLIGGRFSVIGNYIGTFTGRDILRNVLDMPPPPKPILGVVLLPHIDIFYIYSVQLQTSNTTQCQSNDSGYSLFIRIWFL